MPQKTGIPDSVLRRIGWTKEEFRRVSMRRVPKVAPDVAGIVDALRTNALPWHCKDVAHRELMTDAARVIEILATHAKIPGYTKRK